MRYLGIDYGEKRIGLALSDKDGKIAFPYATIAARGRKDTRIFPALRVIIDREKISAIILGLPRAADGRDTKQTAAVRGFAEKLKKSFSLPVEYENEILTTRMAAKVGIPKEERDAAAAAIILQSYLDRTNMK
ncbi:MAG: Holliday junction resolvase RuvX [Patescibacteria group bacterium]